MADPDGNSSNADQPTPDDKPKQDGQGSPKSDPAKGGGEDDPGENKPKKPNPLKNPKVLIIGGLVVVVLAIGGVLYWLHARQWQSTDDAFVDVHIVRLAPQVSGQVSRVLVDDNVLVHPGQVLVEIDSSSVRTALDQAVAQRSEALAKLAQSQAQIGVSQAAYRQVRDQVAALSSQANVAARDAQRLRNLLATTPRAVAQQQVEDTTAQAHTAAAQRDAAAHQAEGAAAQVKAAETGIDAANAELKAADATIAQNQITLGHTQVIAPIEGYVTQKNVAPGGYVQPGQQLMAVVPRQMWVTANFKETQLKLVRVGQLVDMKIDACPADLHGKVLSIQRGAGQAFALLPSENATGNFVKVVQRVPVKIGFDNVPKECPLGPGLSVTPKVKVR